MRGQTSVKFPTSRSAVMPERVTDARLVGATSDERLTDPTTSGKSLLIRHRPTTAGPVMRFIMPGHASVMNGPSDR